MAKSRDGNGMVLFVVACMVCLFVFVMPASIGRIEVIDLGRDGSAAAVTESVTVLLDVAKWDILEAEVLGSSYFTERYTIPEIGQVATRDHAVLGHGADALTCRAVFAGGPLDRRADCKATNRIIAGKFFTDAEGLQRFAFTVISMSTGNELTTFSVPKVKSQEFWSRVKEMHRCDDHSGHDNSNGPIPLAQ